jgi:hypothetical protein
MPLTFYYLYRINPHAASQHQMSMKMSYPLTLILSHQGRGKKKKASHEGAREKEQKN